MLERDDSDNAPLTDANDRQARQWAMWIHLSALCHFVVPIPGVAIIAPLILWSMKKEDSSFIDEQGREAVNFQISILIYVVVSIVLCFVLIGFPLLIAVLLFQLICCVMAALRANEGEHFQYPMNIRFM